MLSPLRERNTCVRAPIYAGLPPRSRLRCTRRTRASPTGDVLRCVEAPRVAREPRPVRCRATLSEVRAAPPPEVVHGGTGLWDELHTVQRSPTFQLKRVRAPRMMDGLAGSSSSTRVAIGFRVCRSHRSRLHEHHPHAHVAAVKSSSGDGTTAHRAPGGALFRSSAHRVPGERSSEAALIAHRSNVR
jgi:hypothetical protein